MANLNDLNRMAASQLGGAMAAPVKETPVTRLSDALARLRASRNLVGSVADKLVGERCEDEGCGTAGPLRSGIFGEIEDIADTISRLAGDIEYSASRIADRL